MGRLGDGIELLLQELGIDELPKAHLDQGRRGRCQAHIVTPPFGDDNQNAHDASHSVRPAVGVKSGACDRTTRGTIDILQTAR
jgi:hypothetical protein